MRIKYLGIFLVMISSEILATEGGGSNYLPGFYGDFEMAVMPQEKGTYFNNFMSLSKDANGSADTIIEIPGVLHVTDYKIFDGRYVFGLYPGLAAIESPNDGTNSKRLGLLDAYLMPLAINWKWDHVSILAYEGIIAPIGYYQRDSFNTGRNIWTFDHVVALTWRFLTDNELSMTLGYMNNLKNDATGYKSGNEIHLDYMLGHYINPEVAAGVTGTYYRQINIDQAPANVLSTVFSEATSIGPVIMYTSNIFDREVNLSLKWLHEFNVQGRLSQDYVIWRVFMSF
ncbi:MAG: SphA family protein [Methylobacter sp.]